jgi:sigma-B regulation protein RsbU (phosphoserine phosphatase)
MPYLLRATGGLDRVDGKPQAPLAVRAGIRYQNQRVSLQPGDALFACTDGVVEAMNGAGELYSAERLEARLRSVAGATPEAMVHAIKLDVDTFTGGAPKADDVAVLAVRRPAAAA